MLEHGGKLRVAAQNYGIPISDWLDLSTGINPRGWPVPEIPNSIWVRLPEDEDELIKAAIEYYRCSSLLPCAGSQAAIQALPRLRAFSKVGVLSPSYNEHAHAWRRAGHEVIELSESQITDTLPSLDVLVLVNPNNPTAHLYSRNTLLEWRTNLHARGGWLVVDEAFMDATPDASLSTLCPLPGLIVFRSLGKFFGLAGARVGFVLAEKKLLSDLDDYLGPWTLSNPSRFVATRALQDTAWQRETIAHLDGDSVRLHDLLSAHFLAPHGVTTLFQWVQHRNATNIHHALAQQGILVRLFTTPASLRFGLPSSESHWRRLEHALSKLTEVHA